MAFFWPSHCSTNNFLSTTVRQTIFCRQLFNKLFFVDNCSTNHFLSSDCSRRTNFRPISFQKKCSTLDKLLSGRWIGIVTVGQFRMSKTNKKSRLFGKENCRTNVVKQSFSRVKSISSGVPNCFYWTWSKIYDPSLEGFLKTFSHKKVSILEPKDWFCFPVYWEY
jgi:hypothetical protein